MKKAILLIIFNRPDVTQKAIEAISKYQPEKIYVAADGPRNPEEQTRCDLTRTASTNVNWDCEVITRFRDENLGPMYSQIDAVNWFFSKEDHGIVLEDDCLPDTSFFTFCENLLEKYNDDERIFMISGNNFQDGIKRGDGDYYFSCYTHIWGWATWRRSWEKFDANLESWPVFKSSGHLEYMHSKKTARYWGDLFEQIYQGIYKRGWDYRFLYTCWKENGLVALPNENLVSNIGFGAGATNCMNPDSEFANIGLGSVSGSIIHPTIIRRDAAADALTSRKMFVREALIRRLLRLVRNPNKFFTKIVRKIFTVKL